MHNFSYWLVYYSKLMALHVWIVEVIIFISVRERRGGRKGKGLGSGKGNKFENGQELKG